MWESADRLYDIDVPLWHVRKVAFGAAAGAVER